MPQPKLPPSKRAEIVSLLSQGMSQRAVARVVGVAQGTVANVARDHDAEKHGDTVRKLATKKPRRVDVDDLPAGVHEEDDFPAPVEQTFTHVRLDGPSKILVITDTHIPGHDRQTIYAAVKEGKQRGVDTVLLNGDILDCAMVSRHPKDGTEVDLDYEMELGEQFVSWLRNQFPKARIIYKEGNHEERLPKYLIDKAPELHKNRKLAVPVQLNLVSYGVEWVDDKRTIYAGDLPIIHGHEYSGGGGINPARSLWLKMGMSAVAGHYHRSHTYPFQSHDGRLHEIHTVGCACYIHPRYLRYNQWQHGYALVEVSSGGAFHVSNRTVR